MAQKRVDLARIVLAILFLAALIFSSLWILSPFLPAGIWAVTIVIATWPIMSRAQTWLWNKRALAVLAMTLVLLLLFFLPFAAAIGVIAGNAGKIADWADKISSMEVPPPPSWLADIPLAGERIMKFWNDIGSAGIHELLLKAQPYAGPLTREALSTVGSFGLVLVQFLLTVGFSAILYARGEAAAAGVIRFGRRLAGERGERSLRLAAQAIRGVALGVVLTALAQTAVSGVGLMLAGVPFAPILIAVTFMLCIAQLGPAPVVIPALIWMFATQSAFWAGLLLVFSLVALTLDNVLRPILIRKGADLPLLLILVGVIGGLLAFGLIGLFIGPTILAVAYTLLREWIAEGEPAELAD
ncbi:MAG TPA: AI-2E family transporter YdiK [Stellaceae bacterium]|nr:AI-2E family transporter YdiK [Stellaceae bacterium]